MHVEDEDKAKDNKSRSIFGFKSKKKICENNNK